jgi:hypothetical protein
MLGPGALNSDHLSDDQDTWIWKHDAIGFSVKSTYTVLKSTLGVSVQSAVVSGQVLTKIWKSWLPSKAIAFSWQLLQDMISTRQNLFSRHVIKNLSNIMYIFCETIV